MNTNATRNTLLKWDEMTSRPNIINGTACLNYEKVEKEAKETGKSKP